MRAASLPDICRISPPPPPLRLPFLGPQGGRRDQRQKKKDGRGGRRVASGAGPASRCGGGGGWVGGWGGQQWLSRSFDNACPSLTPPATPAPPTSQPLWRDETFCSFSMTGSAGGRCRGSFVRLRQAAGRRRTKGTVALKGTDGRTE